MRITTGITPAKFAKFIDNLGERDKKIKELQVGSWIVTPLGGDAQITSIDGYRVSFKNGGFSGSCHVDDLKGRVG